MGLPDEERHLTEFEEDAGDYVTLLAPDAALDASDHFGAALALWSSSWPNWTPPRSPRWNERRWALIEARWRHLLQHASPIGAAYLFHPAPPRSLEESELAKRDYQKTFETLQREASAHPIGSKRTVWTVTLHPSDESRVLFEELSGLTAPVKSRLGLDGGDPGFLRRYVTAHAAPVEELVTPRQFEEVIADIYRAEGWTCHVTRYSKDGGIDIEARRDVDGAEVVLLIQVKRNRSKTSLRGRARPVGLDDVKVFAATIRAEGNKDGVLVSSSHFTRGALRWAETKGRAVARVTFVDGEDVRARLETVPIVTDEQRLLLEYAAKHGQGEGERLFSSLENFKRELREAAEAAEIEHLSPHDLRRAGGQWLVDLGMPLEFIRRVMGHRDIRITQLVYADVRDEDLPDRMLDAIPTEYAKARSWGPNRSPGG